MNKDINLNEVFNDHSSAPPSNDSETSSEILYEDASNRSQNSKNFRTPKIPYTSAMYDKSDHTKDNPHLKMTTGSEVIVTEYDSVGNPSKVIDPIRKVYYTYHYNKNGFLSSIEERPINSSTLIGKHNYSYDNENCLISHYDARTGHTYHTIYEDKTSNVICPNKITKGICLASKYTDLITRDALQRVSARNLTLNSASSPLIIDSYSYLRNNDRETIFVKMLSHQVNSEMVCVLDYTYDRRGNIETVSQNGNMQVKYTYDRMNRLVCEDNYEVMCRYQYTYDDRGNITYKVIYTLSRDRSPYKLDNIVIYCYDHDGADKLISYENNYGTDPEITYDSFGNLAKYRGNILAWTINHRLASYGSNMFEYDATGIRYKKNSITYTLDGSKILKEIDGGKTLVYYYGTSGVIGFNYNGTDYYYEKNLQGDVTAIYNANGVLATEYLYDAWGKVLKITNHTSDNIGNINPFRYRGYYYDIETGLYYLQTRYYDPEVGRFINSDTVNTKEELSGCNELAYCNNNPILYSAPTGKIDL